LFRSAPRGSSPASANLTALPPPGTLIADAVFRGAKSMVEPMLAPAAAATQPVDRELFSLHPEEQMTERPSHRLQGTYIEQALPRVLPGWYVAANMAVYWAPGEMEYPYVGPDVLVARNAPAREDPSVYLTY